MSGAKKSNRIRPVSRDARFPRIRKLKSFTEVYERIIEGWPIAEVARFIQEIKKECTDLTRSSLITLLQDFRQSLPPAELTKRRLPSVFVDAAKEVEEGIDELVELEKLYKLQMRRLSIDIENEKKINKLLPSTGQEVRIAREILSTYADLKMDLGLSKRHLGQVDVDARVLADVAVRYNKPEVQTVLSDPQSRKKVLSLVERLVSKSATALLAESPASVPAPAPAVIDVPAETTPLPESEALEGNLLNEDEADPLAAPIPAVEEPA